MTKTDLENVVDVISQVAKECFSEDKKDQPDDVFVVCYYHKNPQDFGIKTFCSNVPFTKVMASLEIVKTKLSMEYLKHGE